MSGPFESDGMHACTGCISVSSLIRKSCRENVSEPMLTPGVNPLNRTLLEADPGKCEELTASVWAFTEEPVRSQN